MNSNQNILLVGLGKSGRIGQSLCDYFLQAGHRVFATTRNQHQEQDLGLGLHQAIEQKKLVLFHTDLSQANDIMDVVDASGAEIIIFNLSNFIPFSSNNLNPTDRLEAQALHLDDCFLAHIKIPTLLSSYVAESYIKSHKNCLFIFLGDAFLQKGGIYPYDYLHYSVTKHTTVDIARGIQAKFGTLGMRCITLLLGPILPATKTSNETKNRLSLEMKTPDQTIGEWIGVESVIHAIEFVIANPYVSEVIYIDGSRNWQTTKES